MRYTSFSGLKGLTWFKNYENIVNWTNGKIKTLLPPIGVTIDLTTGCNLHCRFCNAFRSWNNRQTLDKEEVFKMIDMLKKWRGKRKDVLRSLCYDKETEVLTKNGFKYFKDIKFEDEIATLNDEGFLEYHNPIYIQKLKYSGDMINFKGLYYDLLVTPDHSMYINEWNKGWKFLRAETIFDNFKNVKYELKRDSNWIGKNVECFKIPNNSSMPYSDDYLKKYEEAIKIRKETGFGKLKISKMINVPPSTVQKWISGKSNPNKGGLPKKLKDINIDLWLKFFGWWITEGSIATKKVGVVDITQTRKHMDNRKEIFSILEELGVKIGNRCYSEFVKDIRFWNIDIYNYLKQFGHAKNKFIPEWIKDLPIEKLDILIKTMLKGDGSKHKRENNLYSYYTISPKLRDDFWEICLKAGYSITCSGDIRPLEYQNRNIVFHLMISKGRNTPAMNCYPKKIKYNDLVYDVTVPNSTIYVRRNGKGVWSGNCVAGGGEPTLHPSFPEIIEYAHNAGFQVGVSTNGLQFGNKLIRNKILEHAEFCGISIDSGSKEVWSYIKNVDASNYEVLLSGLRKLLKDHKEYNRSPRKCDIVYKFLITKDNQYDILNGAKLAKDIGFKTFYVRPAAMAKLEIFGGKDQELDVNKIMDQLEEAKKLESDDFVVDYSFNRVNEKLGRIHNFKKCWATPILAQFCADGFLYSCIDSRYIEKHKQVHWSKVRKYWSSKKHRDFINAINIEDCVRCAQGGVSEQIEKCYIEDDLYRFFP